MITLCHSNIQLAYPTDKETLLEALEHYQIPMEYQCRSGYCGACRCRMKKGGVHYQIQPLAMLRQGEILPCCCTPVDDIELEL